MIRDQKSRDVGYREALKLVVTYSLVTEFSPRKHWVETFCIPQTECAKFVNESKLRFNRFRTSKMAREFG